MEWAYQDTRGGRDILEWPTGCHAILTSVPANGLRKADSDKGAVCGGPRLICKWISKGWGTCYRGSILPLRSTLSLIPGIDCVWLETSFPVTYEYGHATTDPNPIMIGSRSRSKFQPKRHRRLCLPSAGFWKPLLSVDQRA